MSGVQAWAVLYAIGALFVVFGAAMARRRPVREIECLCPECVRARKGL